MEYSTDYADGDVDHGDNVPQLSMLEVLKQRKRRWRLPIDVSEEEENDNEDWKRNGGFPFHQRNLGAKKSIRTKEEQLSSQERNASFHLSVDNRMSKPKTRPIHPFNTRKLLLWSLVVVTTSSALFLRSIQQLKGAIAFQLATQQRSPSAIPRFMSLATPPSSTSSQHATIPSRSDLESMKVIDLKELIKISGHNERGLLSKLKKKQDLIEFLAEKGTAVVDAPSVDTPPPTPVLKAKAKANAQTTKQQLPRQPRKMPITMPKKKTTMTTPAAVATDADDSFSDDESAPRKASPMQELFDRVYEQYPPLEFLHDGNRTLHGELDVRQRYHPMLQAGMLQTIPESEDDDEIENDDNSENDAELSEKKFKPALSGDMDLIFVGTASCTPSITRGVSCTALRLHSLASSSSQANTKKKSKKKGQFDVESSQSTNLGTWLFDCGESTQLQIQKTSSVRPSKITKIFLTHAHGDHSFGLPGLLCLMGQDTAGGNESSGDRKTKESKQPIDIYGPEGLRLWLRTAIRYSVSRIVPRYRVHELKDVAMAPEWGYSPKWEKYYFNKAAFHDIRNNNNANGNNGNSEFYWGAANDVRKRSIHDSRRRGQTSDWLSICDQKIPGIEPSELYGEVEGGRDIYPIYDHPLSNDGAPVWEVEHEGGGEDPESDPSTGEPNSGVKVYAAPMSHGVPCVGYVIQEANRPGRLRDEFVKPICMRNIPALKEAGFRHPMKAMAVIKDLPEGGSFTFPDGTVVTQEESVEPTRPGRKIVICGDTNSARSLDNLAKNADVIVHESTNAFLPNYDHRVSNPNSVNRDAIFHGHSTPQIAGDFARRAGARRLILNHFSARYMGDQSIESMSIMTRIEEQAMKASGLTRSHVAAAWDFMIFPIPKAHQKNEQGDGDVSD